MARKRQFERTSGPSFHRTLTSPGVYLMRMAVFLALVGFIAAILSPQLWVSFQQNPALNGLIIAVLFFGIIFSFRQVFRLYPEIRWVNAFRIADPGLAIDHKPVLLAPMATMLRDRTGALSLSTSAMRSIMDSIGGRLDEARDTGRYLVGLLVFLGLLGTFWGLLDTIQSVGRTIAALDTKAADAGVLFDDLKSGLAAPLKGMGTAFSSSLLGLAGSLVLGFLELQASHAHNRFHNELEEWLSHITELTPGEAGSLEQLNRQLYTALFDMQRSIGDVAERLGSGTGGDAQSVQDLNTGIQQLIAQMRAEQNIVRQWVDDQSNQSQEVVAVLRHIAENLPRRG
ncbi:MAG: putative rane protein [Pseudomonadota bacterium]|jgi:hypothetical protein